MAVPIQDRVDDVVKKLDEGETILDLKRFDQQRLDDYKSCVSRVDDKHAKAGLPFIVSVLSGDIPGAVEDWIDFVVKTANDDSDCMQFLSPEQRKLVLEEAKKAQMRHWHDVHDPR